MADIQMSTLDEQNETILNHLWVVVSVASRLKNFMLFSAEWDELISAGNLALVRAGRNFKGLNGCQFKTYAYKSIRGEMLRAFTRIDGHHDSALIEFEPLPEIPIEALQETNVYKAEKLRLAAQIVDSLKPRHREVIRAFINGESLVAFAEARNIKRDRVMKWQRTAIKQSVRAGAEFR